jgi:hypothetical protein
MDFERRRGKPSSTREATLSVASRDTFATLQCKILSARYRAREKDVTAFPERPRKTARGVVMNSSWRVVELMNAAEEYARVEAQIADLDLALDLLGRLRRGHDAVLMQRSYAVARETLESVQFALAQLHPDDSQQVRIERCVQRLRQRLDMDSGRDRTVAPHPAARSTAARRLN